MLLVLRIFVFFGFIIYKKKCLYEKNFVGIKYKFYYKLMVENVYVFGRGW